MCTEEKIEKIINNKILISEKTIMPLLERINERFEEYLALREKTCPQREKLNRVVYARHKCIKEEVIEKLERQMDKINITKANIRSTIWWAVFIAGAVFGAISRFI